MKIYLGAALITLALAVLLACVRLQLTGDGAADLQDGSRPLRIGYAIEPPFVMLEPDGRVSGEAPEVLRATLERAGLPQGIWLHSEFGSLLDELEAGRIDLIAAGMFITPERQQHARFTRPTLQVRPGLLTAAGNPHQLQSMLDLLQRPDLRLAVIDGSVEMAQARSLGIHRLLPAPDVQSALEAIALGQADALALSLVSLNYFKARQSHPFEVLTDSLREQRFGSGQPAFVVRKDDPALQQQLDQALAVYLGSPQHQALLDRYRIAPPAEPAP